MLRCSSTLSLIVVNVEKSMEQDGLNFPWLFPLPNTSILMPKMFAALPKMSTKEILVFSKVNLKTDAFNLLLTSFSWENSHSTFKVSNGNNEIMKRFSRSDNSSTNTKSMLLNTSIYSYVLHLTLYTTVMLCVCNIYYIT